MSNPLDNNTNSDYKNYIIEDERGTYIKNRTNIFFFLRFAKNTQLSMPLYLYLYVVPK